MTSGETRPGSDAIEVPAQSQEPGPSLLSYFWTPLVAVGASDGQQMNAQISVSTFGAGIVPDRPRLLCVLYKHNLTHDFVARSGSLSVNLLGPWQLHLLDPLGLVSGREGDKLHGLGAVPSRRGNPIFPESIGYLECEVIASYDLGDATAFLVAVLDEQRLRGGDPVTWAAARPLLPREWHARWDAKIARDIERSRAVMRWINQ